MTSNSKQLYAVTMGELINEWANQHHPELIDKDVEVEISGKGVITITVKTGGGKDADTR